MDRHVCRSPEGSAQNQVGGLQEHVQSHNKASALPRLYSDNQHECPCKAFFTHTEEHSYTSCKHVQVSFIHMRWAYATVRATSTNCFKVSACILTEATHWSCFPLFFNTKAVKDLHKLLHFDPFDRVEVRLSQPCDLSQANTKRWVAGKVNATAQIASKSLKRDGQQRAQWRLQKLMALMHESVAYTYSSDLLPVLPILAYLHRSLYNI